MTEDRGDKSPQCRCVHRPADQRCIFPECLKLPDIPEVNERWFERATLRLPGARDPDWDEDAYT